MSSSIFLSVVCFLITRAIFRSCMLVGLTPTCKAASRGGDGGGGPSGIWECFRVSHGEFGGASTGLWGVHWVSAGVGRFYFVDDWWFCIISSLGKMGGEFRGCKGIVGLRLSGR